VPEWLDGEWHNQPLAAALAQGDFLVAAEKGSDAWRETAYGYVTDSAHALLAPMPDESSVEVTLIADLTAQFDQAGIMVRASETEWIKAGVEYADGVLQLGAVVTHTKSDWSTSPVDWAGLSVTIRASRSGDAVMIRARADDGEWRLIRVAHIDPSLQYGAGPYLAAPTRDGLTVRFTGWATGPADAEVHPDGLPDTFA
jgi:regulation of enolase protein 1 (concanavalin A-like superfamily)